ncbi:hypothetical protein [Marivita sp. XM-24bin2]|uniref:hypothetical protein n=1 Tax=Marivita sp. XM-24bin2 TaxID=2133951 RepID=UPI0025C5BE76|nr:hypothetical protein [Marivita sp. XM-24bin2]
MNLALLCEFFVVCSNLIELKNSNRRKLSEILGTLFSGVPLQKMTFATREFRARIFCCFDRSLSEAEFSTKSSTCGHTELGLIVVVVNFSPVARVRLKAHQFPLGYVIQGSKKRAVVCLIGFVRLFPWAGKRVRAAASRYQFVRMLSPVGEGLFSDVAIGTS